MSSQARDISRYDAEGREEIRELGSLLRRALARRDEALAERNAFIIEARQDGMSYATIGEIVGLTRQRVHQIVQRAQAS